MNVTDRIAQDLLALGVKPGDTLVVRVALRNVLSEDERGRLSAEKRRSYFLDSLQEVLGPQGSLMVLAFTKQFIWPKIPKNYFFSKDCEPTTGSLTKLILEMNDSLRSLHPTNSFAAIGPQAAFLLEGHDETAPAYAPIGKLIECGGKFLNIGVDPQSPGFTTAHWAQYELGLANQFRFRVGVNYIDPNGKKHRFYRKDVGGCSSAFSNFYPLYREAKIVNEGMIGNAQAMLMTDTKKAFEIEKKILSEKPEFVFCQNPSCLSCRVGWKYSKTSPIKYFAHRVKSRVKRPSAGSEFISG